MLLCNLVRRYLFTQLLFYKGMTFLNGQVGQDKKMLTSWVGPSALPIRSEFSYPALPTHVEMLHSLIECLIFTSLDRSEKPISRPIGREIGFK